MRARDELANARDQLIDRRRHGVKKWRGLQADEQDDEKDRQQDSNLLPVQPRQRTILFLVHLTHVNLLEHVKHVDRGQDDTQRGKHGEEEAQHLAAHRAQQDGEFAHEAI